MPAHPSRFAKKPDKPQPKPHHKPGRNYQRAPTARHALKAERP